MHIVAQSLSEEAGAVWAGEGLGTIPLTSQPNACVGLNNKEHFVGGTLDGGAEGVDEAVESKIETEGVMIGFTRALQSKQPSS